MWKQTNAVYTIESNTKYYIFGYKDIVKKSEIYLQYSEGPGFENLVRL